MNASAAPSCPHCGAAITGMRLLTVHVPVKLVSEANAHEHWRARQKRAAEQHSVWAVASLRACNIQREAAVKSIEMGGLGVVITRLEPRELDSDNATGSAKHLRDAIAKWLGIDDKDKRVKWVVTQEKPGAGPRGARVEFWWRATAQEGRRVGA